MTTRPKRRRLEIDRYARVVNSSLSPRRERERGRQGAEKEGGKRLDKYGWFVREDYNYLREIHADRAMQFTSAE